MAFLMSIDLGSTSIKALIYDYNGKLIASGFMPNQVDYMDKEHPNWAFWDPDRVWKSVLAAIGQAIGKIGDPRKIKGISVTGMGADGLPVDKNGKWLYPFISWHCKRTQPICERWETEVGSEKIFSVTGHQSVAYDSIYRLMWMNENHPEILLKTDKWLLIEDYINFLLCGRMATDFSMAASTSAFDLGNKSWSEELIGISGINREVFAEALQSGTFLGEVNVAAASQTGLCKGTPVILGGHDYYCAALAVGAFEPGIIMDITGTFEMVLTSSKELKLDKEIKEAGLTVESHVASNVYGIMGFNVSADMFEWFRACYGFEEKMLAKESSKKEWDFLMEKAQAAPYGSNGVFFLPHFSGSFCPVMDGHSQGAFIGLSKTVEKRDMLRAIIEGLNYQFKDMIEAFELPINEKADRIIAVGGATKNSFWMQNKADITGKIIEVPDLEEATGLGAAILAGKGIGIYKNEQDAVERTFRKGKSYYPETALNKKYEQLFNIYKKIYPALKAVNNDIFNIFRL